ncbi:MAG: protein kinase [Deltaproteobacteria bacterium]|nr:protein kinase [Deltaproteobacteria bacterium]
MADQTNIDAGASHPLVSVPPETSLVGQTLDGRYRVTKRLAEGGMGVVYEAEDSIRSRKVAVKSLHAYLANDEEIEARFRREAHAIAAIAHPNVIEVYDSGALPDGRHYLVLELLSGRDLSRALRDQGPMSVGAVARILSEIADGLAVAHDKGIIHRDLKPENVFLLDETVGKERIKVMDFGVARYAGAPVDARTRTGTTVGTPYYMAPEQAQGRKEIDLRADVYALGVMGFRMLTGHHPFDDESYPMLVVKICTEPPPSIATWREDVPAELELLLDRMMSKTANARPGTMRDVREALRVFTSMDGAPRLTDAPPPSRELPAVLDSGSGNPGSSERTQPAARITSGLGRTDPSRPPAGAHMHDDDDVDEAKTMALGGNKGVLPYVVGGFGILCAGLFAWMILGPDDAPMPEPEPDALALPEPRPPTTRALQPGGSSEGWGFLNPRPRVMPQWNAVATAGPGIVAMVGANGTAAHLVRGLLLTWRTGTTRSLYGVAWTSAEDAIAVGEDGAIVRLDPAGPSSVDGGTHATLRAVAKVSATEEIAVGDDGAIVRLLGDRVLTVPVEGNPDLLAIDARDGIATVVGEAGTVIRITDGHSTRLEAPTSQTLRAVGGCDDGLYVAGDEGVLLRQSTSGFRPVRVEPATRSMFTSISCDHGRTVVVGADGEVRLVSGLRSVKLETGFDGVLTGVSGAADEATWIVGTSGRLAVVVSDHVETRVSGPIASLRDIADIGGALVAVGDWGKLVREHEDGLVLDQAPTEAGLGSVSRMGEGSLVAVGDGGTILRIRFDGADVLSSPTDSALRGVVAREGAILAVGAEGTVVRGSPTSLVPTRIANVGDLAAIAGDPSDAIAVGDQGAIVRLTSNGSRVVDCGLSLGLRGVVREDAAGPAFAVGEAAGIVRIEPDGSCVTEHHTEGAPMLNGIGRGPDGHLLAVGDMGTAFTRGDDGTWSPLDLDVGIVSLRAVRSIDRWVFVVGAGGVILRHIRIDGH